MLKSSSYSGVPKGVPPCDGGDTLFSGDMVPKWISTGFQPGVGTITMLSCILPVLPRVRSLRNMLSSSFSHAINLLYLILAPPAWLPLTSWNNLLKLDVLRGLWYGSGFQWIHMSFMLPLNPSYHRCSYVSHKPSIFAYHIPFLAQLGWVHLCNCWYWAYGLFCSPWSGATMIGGLGHLDICPTW